MTMEKVDPALTQEFELLTAKGFSDSPVPVIIEHVEPAAVVGEGDSRVRLPELERRVRELQRGIMERLRDLEVGEVPRQLILANAIVVPLRRSQVVELATHPDVKRIHLSRKDYVTT